VIKEKLRFNIRDIPEYVPGRTVDEIKRRYNIDRVVKLASNENPYGTSERVYEVLKNFRDFHVYPKLNEDLIEKLSDYVGFEPERIVISAGSDGIIENAFKLFVDPGDEVVIPIPTFSYYHTVATVYGARVLNVKRCEDYRIDVDSIIGAVSEKTKIVMICSPNNPTGNSEVYEDVREIVESVDCLVLVDEAYAEFSSDVLIDLADYENVIVSRTFSKAFGLANMRIGYGVMDKDLVKEYKKVDLPFPVSSIAMLCALAVLEDLDFVRSCVDKIVEERERLYRELLKRGLKTYPSQANFLFFKSPIRSRYFVEEMAKRGVILRDCSNFIGCDDFSVRVSIGKRDENDFFLNALDDFLDDLKY